LSMRADLKRTKLLFKAKTHPTSRIKQRSGRR